MACPRTNVSRCNASTAHAQFAVGAHKRRDCGRIAPRAVSTQERQMAIKPTADFANFDALDIRAGRIAQVEDAQTRKPTYKLTIDFGPEIGSKVSCGAYRTYAKDDLIGKTVICVVNFAAKKMGPEISEVLVLGIANAAGETIYLTTQQDVPLGGAVF
jgi:tRNA-binding protein